MKEDLHKTRWTRLAIRLHVPSTMGVFFVTARGRAVAGEVFVVGSATNLRKRLLELLDLEALRDKSAGVVHWVSDLTEEQARLAERLFVRRYDPPLKGDSGSRYLDILAG